MPELAKKCIASWKKYLPDYEIKEWNEQNFDVMRTAYSSEAYSLKKYAHVSDYARFWILYNYGGIYFDTDVEVIRPLDDIIAKGTFMGFECQEGIAEDNPNGNMAAGLGMGVYPGHPFFRDMVDFYEHFHFAGWNGRKTGNIVFLATKFLDYDHKQVLDGGIVKVSDLLVYPEEYFCPVNYYTKETHITENTRTIHHYMSSCNSPASQPYPFSERIRFILARLRSSFKITVNR